MSGDPKNSDNPQRGAALEHVWRIQRHTRAWRPATDVLESDDAFQVIVEVAGMRGSEFTVTCDSRTLTVNGIRPESRETKTVPQVAFHQMEIAHGEFIIEVRLPSPVDTSAIKAKYADGFLRIVLPKVRSTRVPMGG